MATISINKCQVTGCSNTATVRVHPEPIDGVKESSHEICDVHHSFTDENGVKPFQAGCTFERLVQN